jgi:nitronate monooxygenase
MSFASSLPLTLACCQAGVVGGWQGSQVRDLGEFAKVLDTLREAEQAARDAGRPFAPHAVNLRASSARDSGIGARRLELCATARIPLVISSVGDPTEMAARVHDWGGFLIHDVSTVRHAERALEAGVDGLMLTCAGAGGLTGHLTPLAFVPKIRSMFDGLLMVGGGIATGAGIAGALALGADLAVMGTRFIATRESGAVAGHKQMIAEAGMADIIASDALTGVEANWIRQSIERVGLDPGQLLERQQGRPGAVLPEGALAWRDVWSAGHSTGLIDDVPSVSVVVARLAREFEVATRPREWRNRLP